jgi:hypothetical protein
MFEDVGRLICSWARRDDVTEQEWRSCGNPHRMLSSIHGRVSQRRLRLFACACCRRIWYLLTDPRSRQTVEFAELFLDGNAAEAERAIAFDAAQAAAVDAGEDSVAAAAAEAAADAASVIGPYYANAATDAVLGIGDDELQQKAEMDRQCDLLRDIFGNPFRPVSIDPAWQTPTVTALAQAAYDHRSLPAGTLEPARLAVLADALEEAGCDNADVLSHLRQSGEHVRGCWVVDLLTGRL